MITPKYQKRKSVALSTDEYDALKIYRSRFETEVSCAASIRIDRLVLNRVLLVGSGAPDTIKKIQVALKKKSKAA